MSMVWDVSQFLEHMRIIHKYNFYSLLMDTLSEGSFINQVDQ